MHSTQYQSNWCWFIHLMLSSAFADEFLDVSTKLECRLWLLRAYSKHTAQHYSTHTHTHKKEHIRIRTFSCSGRQRPAHSPFLVFLFGLPSLLCPLSKHHSFLLRDPALGCGLRGLAPTHSSPTLLKTLLCTVLCLQLKSRGAGGVWGHYLLICSSLTCLQCTLS